MNYFHYILLVIGIITTAIFFQSDTLQNVEARSISSFSWQIDEKYTRDGFVDFIVPNDSHNSLPVTVHSISDKPITLTLHTTSNFDQMGKAKLPRGVDAFFEPAEFRLEPNQTKQVELIINVDKNAPSNLYDLQIVGTWKEVGKIPDFMGSSIRLHVGRDFGIQKIPVNMLSPPLKIWKESYNEENFTINDVQCRNDFVLVVKASNGNPACVKPETKTKLLERGWGEHAPVSEPEIIKETDFDSEKYYEEFDSGSPLMYLDTSTPVLNNDNCERYAYWLTKYQKEKLDRYEDYPRYPPWGNQIFPLVDYCTNVGDLTKTVVDDKIHWEFQLENEN